jgi:hypothetical protein
MRFGIVQNPALKITQLKSKITEKTGFLNEVMAVSKNRK